MKTMLLAVGGNSLIRAGEKGTIAEQRANAQRTAAQIVELDPCRLPDRAHPWQWPAGWGGASALRTRSKPGSRDSRWTFVAPPRRVRSDIFSSSRCKPSCSQPVCTCQSRHVLTQSLVSLHDPAMTAPQQTDRPFLLARRSRGTQASSGMGNRGGRSPRLSPCGAVA